MTMSKKKCLEEVQTLYTCICLYFIFQVRNRDPAPVQITAEQLLRDAKERQAAEIRTPVQRLQNSEVCLFSLKSLLLGNGRMAFLKETWI